MTCEPRRSGPAAQVDRAAAAEEAERLAVEHVPAAHNVDRGQFLVAARRDAEVGRRNRKRRLERVDFEAERVAGAARRLREGEHRTQDAPASAKCCPSTHDAVNGAL